MMLLQCAAMVVKKLLVDDKISASVRQICLLGQIYSKLGSNNPELVQDLNSDLKA